MKRILGLALLSALCAGPGFAADDPAWLVEARSREAKPVAVQTIKSKDGFFSIKVPAKLKGEIDPAEGSYSVPLDFGAAFEASCEIYPDGIDLANALREASRVTFEALEPLQGKIEAKAIERTDAGAIGRSPFLAVDWVYRVTTDKGPMLGNLKQIAVAKNGHGVYCVHVDVGYRESFRALVTALVESLETTAKPGTPYLSDVTILSLGTSKVGVVHSTFTRDEDGDTRADSMTSLMIPNGPGTVVAQDSTQVHFIQPDGSLINAVHIQSTNGELDVDLSLSLNDEDQWFVEGQFKGKELKAVMPGGREPASPVSQILLRRKLLSMSDAVGQERTGWTWLAQNPAEFSEWRLKVTGKSDNGQATVQESVAGLTVDMLVTSATGMAISGSMPIGPQTLSLQTIFTEGQL